MDIDNNVPLSQQKRSLSQQKVLMVQAVDRAGKVIKNSKPARDSDGKDGKRNI
jgi:microcompartment protein CcmK/EutM